MILYLSLRAVAYPIQTMTRPVQKSPTARRRVRGVFLGIAAALCVLPLSAWATRPVRVYEVDLAERSGTALQDAMREALVRATGHREAADDPALAGIVADASRYVKNYTTGPHGQSQVVFDGTQVQAAITAAGRGVWDSERPFTLVVLDPPRARAQAEAARAELERVAATRGLPVSVIPMPLTDAAGKALGGDALLEAAQRYGGDEVLVGRGEGANDSALQWTLYRRGASENWNGPLAAGIDRTVDQLVPPPVTTPSQAESDARVRVEGVRTLADYATVTRLLQATPGVKRANIAAAEGTSVSFEVTVRGGAAGLAQALAGQSHLLHGGGAATGTVFRYQP